MREMCALFILSVACSSSATRVLIVHERPDAGGMAGAGAGAGAGGQGGDAAGDAGASGGRQGGQGGADAGPDAAAAGSGGSVTDSGTDAALDAMIEDAGDAGQTGPWEVDGAVTNVAWGPTNDEGCVPTGCTPDTSWVRVGATYYRLQCQILLSNDLGTCTFSCDTPDATADCATLGGVCVSSPNNNLYWCKPGH